MCRSTPALSKRHRPPSAAAPKLPVRAAKPLHPYDKHAVGNFTSATITPAQVLARHSAADAQKYLVAHVGLENFIRNIVRPLDLRLPDAVRFNMNGAGRLRSWEDVYLAERVYTRCLGISKRIYQAHSYAHEPAKGLAYFVLEERNERLYSFLPTFDFHVLVFTYYDENMDVTRVDVQYDQLSFFLHCLGLAQAHAWLVESVITPVAVAWARAYHASGLVNPFTFLVQLMLAPALVCWLLGRLFG